MSTIQGIPLNQDHDDILTELHHQLTQAIPQQKFDLINQIDNDIYLKLPNRLLNYNDLFARLAIQLNIDNNTQLIITLNHTTLTLDGIWNPPQTMNIADPTWTITKLINTIQHMINTTKKTNTLL